MANSLGRPGDAAGFKQHEDTHVAEAASTHLSVESLNGLESFNQFRGAPNIAMSPEVTAMLGAVQIIGDTKGNQDHGDSSLYNMNLQNQDFSPTTETNQSPYGKAAADFSNVSEVTGYYIQGLGAPTNEVSNPYNNMNNNDGNLPPPGFDPSLTAQASMANQSSTNEQALGLGVLALELNALQGLVGGQDQNQTPTADGGQYAPQIPGQNMFGLPQLGGASPLSLGDQNTPAISNSDDTDSDDSSTDSDDSDDSN